MKNLNFLPASFLSQYRQAVQQRLPGESNPGILTESDIACLPAPVIRYLHYAGVVGKPKVTNFRAEFTGSMRQKKDGNWMKIISRDRFLCSDGKNYLNYPWSTPVTSYREIDGRRIPSYGEAIWHTPGGAFAYARFDIRGIEYNAREYK